MRRRAPVRRPPRAEQSGTALRATEAHGEARPAMVAPAIERRVRQASSGGEPLAPGRQRWFEQRLGSSLDRVRIHADAEAGALSDRLGARAFTHGDHVFLGPQAQDLRGGGGRLLAHEFAHSVQQRGTAAMIHRQPQNPQPAQAPVAPTRIDFNFRGAIPVPPVGARTLSATADVQGVTWQLNDGTATVATGTSISNAGVITIGAGQTVGTIEVEASNAAGSFVRDIHFSGHPTGIDSTSAVRDPAGANDYGHVFDHVFTSSTGTVGDIENVAVGERFPNLATPTAANHVIPASVYPFGGSFTLHTATLTPDASNNWFVTASGGLDGNQDNVTITHTNTAGTSTINVGRFIQSASNPTPPGRLPAGFSIDQHLHWYNPLATNAAQRWTDFVTVAHSRFLTNTSGTINFETTVNGVSDGGDTYVGPVALTNLNASPINTPRSAPPPSAGGAAPAPRTVSLAVDTLPSSIPAGQTLTWSIQGGALGCTVTPDPSDPTRATLTIGTTAGTVRVRVAEGSGANFDEVRVQIT